MGGASNRTLQSNRKNRSSWENSPTNTQFDRHTQREWNNEYDVCQRLQVSKADRREMFLLDKSEKAHEREIVNTITAREDRGLSKREKEGTICAIKIMNTAIAHQQDAVHSIWGGEQRNNGKGLQGCPKDCCSAMHRPSREDHQNV